MWLRREVFLKIQMTSPRHVGLGANSKVLDSTHPHPPGARARARASARKVLCSTGTAGTAGDSYSDTRDFLFSP